MNELENRNSERDNLKGKTWRGENNGHIWTGIFLLLIGVVALAKSFGADLPEWMFTWQMLLIGLGLFIGVRHGFRSGGWFVPVLIGGIFMANEYFMDGQLRKHIWPLILISIGLFFIFRPRRTSCRDRWKERKTGDQSMTGGKYDDASYSQDDFINTTAIFGGSKKIVLSKNFKGGDIVNVFGGSEIILTQADINEEATLDLTTIFGGATLVVPSNWSIKSEAVTIFGGIQDKRNMPSITESPTKILVLRGTVIFGGIEIKSF